MSGILILGVGNLLAGDDAVGIRVAEALTGDERLPSGTEVRAAGTDLLRHVDVMRGHRLVVVIDAILGEQPLGTLQAFDGDLASLETHQGHVHHLSLVQALALLRSVTPDLDDVAVIVAGVTIHEARMAPGLTAALEARIPAIADEVLALVRGRTRVDSA